MLTDINRVKIVQPAPVELLRERCGGRLTEIEEKPDGPVARCDREALTAVVAAMNDEPSLAFDYLRAIAGVDYNDHFEIVYLFLSLEHKHAAGLKVRVPRNEPVVPSLTSLYPTADWQEREIFDLYGVVFAGHPDLRRILLPDWWEGHPLRKDYESAAEMRRGGEADPNADTPGYVPPMEWLKNRKGMPTAKPASAPTSPGGAEPPPPGDASAERVARARAKAAAIKAQREGKAEPQA